MNLEKVACEWCGKEFKAHGLKSHKRMCRSMPLPPDDGSHKKKVERILKDRLTPKQKAFLTAYTNQDNKLTYLNGTNSALSAYNCGSDRTASVQAVHELAKPKVKQALREIMEEKGLGEAELMRGLSELTRSDDERVRLSAIDTAFKLHGSYAPVKQQLEHSVTREERQRRREAHLDRLQSIEIKKVTPDKDE